jgi:hypothetical protein
MQHPCDGALGQVVGEEALALGTSGFVRRIRQNHALEHATIHILTRSVPSVHLVGRSDWNGFTLYGEVDTRQVLRAVMEGLARLKEGHSWLALHPRCGTNMAVTALLASSAAASAALVPSRSRLVKAIAIVMAMIGVLQLAPSLSMAAQRSLTTSADMADAHVRRVLRESHGGLTTHRVLITHEEQASSYVLHFAR